LLRAAWPSTSQGGGGARRRTGTLSVAKLTFHVDVNIGDPIWPALQRVVLPRLLDGHLALTGYPLPMVYAEKLVTAVQRGVANTRWRDFADVYTLARRHDVDGRQLMTAMDQVAQYRQVRLAPLAQVLDRYPTLGQRRWAAWRRKQRLDDRLPDVFGQVLAGVIAFADPAIGHTVDDHTWKANEGAWLPHER
jgi:hypothetical protein